MSKPTFHVMIRSRVQFYTITTHTYAEYMLRKTSLSLVPLPEIEIWRSRSASLKIVIFSQFLSRHSRGITTCTHLQLVLVRLPGFMPADRLNLWGYKVRTVPALRREGLPRLHTTQMPFGYILHIPAGLSSSRRSAHRQKYTSGIVVDDPAKP